MSYLTLSEEAKEILNDLFIRYPPGEGVTSDQIAAKRTEKSERRKERPRDDIFCRPPMDKAAITKKVESLSARLEKAANLKQVPDLLSWSHQFVDFFSWLGSVFTGFSIGRTIVFKRSMGIETSLILHVQITEDRSKLPIASFRDVITSSVEGHQVIFYLKFNILSVNLTEHVHLFLVFCFSMLSFKDFSGHMLD